MAGKPLREDPYTGPSRMATDPPTFSDDDEDQGDDVDQGDELVDQDDDEQDTPAPKEGPEAPARRSAPRRRRLPAPPRAVRAGADDASGFLLALMLWGWVVLPYLDGGAERVKDVLRAKCFNKGAKGEWLP